CAVWVTPPFTQSLLPAETADEESRRFLLHWFCEVIQRGRTWSTAVTSQEIRSVTVSHADPSAECTHAMLYYSLDNLTHVNCVPMVLAGLSPRSKLLHVIPQEGVNDHAAKARMRRARRIAQLPPPHIFYGKIWGPVGARAFYSVYLRRDGSYNPF